MKIYVKGQGAVSLNKRHFVAQGGEGDVYVKGDVAYKLFHDPHKAIPPSKILELSAIQDDRVIKPEALVLSSATGGALGYAMPFVRNTEPLCRLFPRAYKERHGIDAPAVHRIIEDLAARVRSVHAAGALVVDLNEMNFLVRLSTEAVFAIDADSYQTPSHPATAIMPSVRDPHTLGRPFDELSDWFAFAVLSFQLLIGVHPYKGKHPKVKGLEPRMRQGLSVMSGLVKLPPVAYPLDIIPDDWAGWYRAVFDRHDRQPPPSAMTGAPVVLAASPIESTGTLTSTELLELGSPIRALQSLLDRTFAALTADGVFIGSRRVADALPPDAVLGVSPRGAVMAAWCDGGRLQVFDVSNGVRLETALGAEAVMAVRDRIYVKHDDKIVELLAHDVGSAVVTSSRWVAQVLPHATRLYDGVALQSLLGATYASLFPSSGLHLQARLPELDDLQVMEARADSHPSRGSLLVVVARDRGGDDCRLVFRIAPDGSSYDVQRHALSSPMGAVGAVLDSGLAIVLREDGKLEAFPVTVGASARRAIEASLSGGVHLSDHHGQLVCARGERVYRLTSHGQTTRPQSQAHVIAT